MKTRLTRQQFVFAFLTLVTLGMAGRLFFKVHLYAVNILFSDQWATYQTLYYRYDIWRSFSFQHGPVRLGVGMLVTQAVANATGWDTRAEAFVTAFILLSLTLAAIYLKWRLFGGLTAWDALIPLTCLGLPQIEALTIVTFPAYSAVPVLLLMLYAICLTCQNVRLRYAALALLNFLLVFSCWGLFAGFLTPFVLVYLLLHHAAARDTRAKRWAAFALLTSLLSLAVFFVDYKVWPAVDCFRFPHYPLQDYLWFIAHLFSSSAAVFCSPNHYYLAGGFGILLLAPFVLVLLASMWGLSREKVYRPRNLVMALFIGFSFIFALNVAVGRVCVGDCAASSSRYQGLLTPAWLALYFTAAAFRKRAHRAAACGLLLMLCFLFPQIRGFVYERNMRHYSEAKKMWAACYLEKEDPVLCDQEVGMSINTPGRGYMIKPHIPYLKQRGLNFFAGR